MNIIASSLLYNICNQQFGNIYLYEADAYYLLIALMERYQIGSCYINNMKRIFELSQRLENLLKTSLPEVFEHIYTNEV